MKEKHLRLKYVITILFIYFMFLHLIIPKIVHTTVAENELVISDFYALDHETQVNILQKYPVLVPMAFVLYDLHDDLHKKTKSLDTLFLNQIKSHILSPIIHPKILTSFTPN